MRARIYITLKAGVLDPAGKAVEQGLHALGYAEAHDVRLGKYIELAMNPPGGDSASAKARVEEMCRKLLANPVVENFRVELG
ncbi:MAG: phosphoribosylformylglycinamidine synthase subunit PurS [Myxococcaceae bacterium]